VAIHLIRHASAGKRTGSSDDFARPLDARGHEQAQAIARLLADSNVDRVLTSPALRCQQTVGALARTCDLKVEVVDWLAEGSSQLAIIRKMMKLGDQDVALCSHGDVIPEVVRTLEAQGMEINGERGWKKGAIWSIHMRDGTATRAEYLAPS
jgi:phosphohistidine phosphatase SixA